jgi:signal transduction histidine kinase
LIQIEIAFLSFASCSCMEEMLVKTQTSHLYLAVFLGAFGGAMLMWAFLSTIPSFWKIRQRRIEEKQKKINLQRVTLDKELERLALGKSRLAKHEGQKETMDKAPATEKAIENERKRIAHELHDDIVQRIAAVRLRLEGFSYHLDKPELVNSLNELGEELNQIMKSLRFVIYGLPQPQFEENSFSTLIADFLIARLNRVASKAVEFKLENEKLEFFLPAHVKKELYNLVQESVQNSLKHSFGFRLRINVSWSSVLDIEIEDNGQGYLPQPGVFPGLGHASMQERAERIGAKLQVLPSTYGVVVKITMLNLYSK